MSRFKVKDNNDQWVDISANGVGVPSGGNQGQILAKRSGTNYDAGWVNPSGGVHVGPTAPSDAFTTIWLDTDEQGASSVSSVNGKNGTVVLDADDVGAMPEWDLLWTNASPTSSFDAQTISLDLSDYQYVFVRYRRDSSGTIKAAQAIVKISDSSEDYVAFGLIDANGKLGRRITAATVTGVSFQAGISYNSYATAGAPQTTSILIPQDIYGIKGVVTT